MEDVKYARHNWKKIKSFKDFEEAREFLEKTFGGTYRKKNVTKTDTKLYFFCHCSKNNCPSKSYLSTETSGKMMTHVYHNGHSHPTTSPTTKKQGLCSPRENVISERYTEKKKLKTFIEEDTEIGERTKKNDSKTRESDLKKTKANKHIIAKNTMSNSNVQESENKEFGTRNTKIKKPRSIIEVPLNRPLARRSKTTTEISILESSISGSRVPDPRSSLFDFSYARYNKRKSQTKTEIKPEATEDNNNNFDNVKNNDPRSSLLDFSVSKYKRKSDKKTETEKKAEDNAIVDVVKVEEQNQLENIMEVIIDSNEDEFYLLKNSEVTGNKVNFEIDKNQNSVTYMEPGDLIYRQAYPGVDSAYFHQSDNAITGSLRIAPYTVKPFEMTSHFRFVYWVLSGEVTVRSTSTISVNGQNCLFGKQLSAGSCIMVPAFAPYTIENRTSQDAVLGYVLLNEKSSDSS